jgi:hypothetical protein
MTPAEIARMQAIESDILALGGQSRDYSAVEKRKAALKNEVAALEAEIAKLRPNNNGADREKGKALRTKINAINRDLSLDNDNFAARYGIEVGKTDPNAPPPGQDAQSMEFTRMFQDLLTKSIASDMAGGGNFTPEQLAGATKFVDETFTKSAQVQLDQVSRDFEQQQRARAAALGRDPNMDMQTQAAIGTRLADLNAQLGAERGAQIAGRLDQLPQRALGSAALGSAFFNDLSQRAYNNRLGLINARSGIADRFAAERGRNSTTSMTTPGEDRGLLGNIGGLVGAGREIGRMIPSGTFSGLGSIFQNSPAQQNYGGEIARGGRNMF